MGGLATAGVEARLEVTVSAASARIATQSPLELRGPFHRDGPPAYFLRNVTAGIFAGDRYRIDLKAEAGARVRVGATSATKVHEMPEGHAAAGTSIEAEAGTTLVYGPQVTILQAGSDFRQATEVLLLPGAVVVLAEVLVMGRTARGESCAFRRFESSLVVRDACRALYEERYAIEPGLALTQALGGFEAVVSVYALGLEAGASTAALRCVVDAVSGVRAGRSVLPNRAGVVLRGLAPSLSSGMATAERCLAALNL